MLECLRIGNGSPGLDKAELGASRIFGAIKVLSDNRRIGYWFPCTRRKFVPSPYSSGSQKINMIKVHFFYQQERNDRRNMTTHMPGKDKDYQQ
jgi:hypothetical protein